MMVTPSVTLLTKEASSLLRIHVRPQAQPLRLGRLTWPTDLARETTAGLWQRGAPWRGSSRDSAQSSRAPGVPVMLYFFVWVLVSQVFSVYELSLIKNIYFPVWMIHCNQNSKVEKVRAA